MTRRIRSFLAKLVSLLTFPWTRSYIHPSVALALAPGARLKLGRWTRIGRHSMLYFREGASLEIGDNTIVGHYANIRPGLAMKIGRDVRIAQFVSILGDNHRFDRVDIPIYQQGETEANVTIEDDVWLGTHVVVLPGVTIGRGSVIGASAVVTRDIPPYSIAVGSPARVIRTRK